ncbi:MAG: hypothetical protein SGPRY_000323 [Prymnesium sp.]
MAPSNSEWSESALLPAVRSSLRMAHRLRSSRHLRYFLNCTSDACPLSRPMHSEQALHALDSLARENIASGNSTRLPTPSWASNATYDDVFGILPEVLTRRTLLFVGDSVMRQTAVDLLLAIRLHREGEPQTQLSATPPVHLVLGINTHCYVWESKAFRFCFLRASRSRGLQLVPKGRNGEVNSSYCLQNDLSTFDLGDVLGCTRHLLAFDSRDVLVVNAGLHHNEPQTSLRANVESFLRWRDHERALGRVPFVVGH